MNTDLPLGKLPAAPVIPSKHKTPVENALIIPSRQTEIVIHGFRLTATGLVAEGDPTYDQWENCGHWLMFAEKKVSFWIGDWLLYGESKYGEKYAQAMDETGLEYGTLANAKNVAQKLDSSLRRENLPISVQSEVATDDLTRDEKKELLDIAEKEELPRSEFRKVVKDYKKKKKLSHLPDTPQWNGDFELDTVNVCAIEDLELPPDSIDMIFTDPPYDDESLPCFEHLGRVARHVLKPGGYMMTYTGKMFLPAVINLLGQSMEYVWEYGVFQPDSNHKINKFHIFQAWRPILCFKKPGDTETMEWQPDMIKGTRDKEFHEWQQQIEPPLKYIEAYTLPGQVVLDPFVGGGTTVVACKQLKRHYLAFDKDESAVKMTIARLNGHKT